MNLARCREEGRDLRDRGGVTSEQSPGGDTEKVVSGVAKEAGLTSVEGDTSV